MDDVSKYLHKEDSDHPFQTKLEHLDLATNWCLCAHEGAYSVAHMDASGFCTWIKIVKGSKIWWLSEEERRPLPGGSWDLGGSKIGTTKDDNKWVELTLKARDEL